MRKIIATFLAFAALSANAATPVIGSLESDPLIRRADCGLFLGNKAGDLVFFAGTDFLAYAQVDGKLVQMNHVKTTNHQKSVGSFLKGDSYKSVFAVEGTEASVALTIVEGCEKMGEKCEEVKLKGTLNINHHGSKVSVPVSGMEHCALQED